jgi:hypothetical protein
MASDGGMPAVFTSSSAIAIASSYAPRRTASFTASTFSDHSYHRIVCVPYEP